MDTFASQPALLPFTVRADALELGDLWLTPEGDLEGVRSVDEVFNEARGQTRVEVLLGEADTFTSFAADEAVTVYRKPTEEQWWAYLLERYDISRWPEG